MKDFFNFMFQYNLIPVINKQRRATNKSETVIDHIITNSYLSSNIKSFIIKTDIYVHLSIFILSNAPDIDEYTKETNIYKRNINKTSIQHFQTLLNNTNWELPADPNEAYNIFLNKFGILYNQAFPEFETKTKTKNLLNPWFSKWLLKSTKRKQKLYNKYLKNKSYNIITHLKW